MKKAKAKIKKVMKGLQKASKTHAAQAKALKGVDEIIDWFKKNRPKRVETIMGMDISNARDAYSNAKTAFKRSQKGGSVDKPLGAGG